MQNNQSLSYLNSDSSIFSFEKQDASLSFDSPSSPTKEIFFKYYDVPRHYKTENFNEVFTWSYNPYAASKDPSLSFFEINPHKSSIRGIGGYILDFGTAFSWLSMTDANKAERICSTIGSKRTKQDGSIVEINDTYALQQIMYNVHLNKDNPTTPNKILQDPSLEVFAFRSKDKDKKLRSCADCISHNEHKNDTPDPFNKNGSSCTPNYRLVFLVTDIAIFDQTSSSWLDEGKEDIKWLSIPDANIKVVEGTKDNPSKHILQKPFIVTFSFSAFYGRKSLGSGPYEVEIDPKPYIPYSCMSLKEYINYLQSPSNFGETCVVNKLTNRNTYPAYTQIFSAKLQQPEGKITSIPVFYHDKDYSNSSNLSHLQMITIGFSIAEEMKGKDGCQPELPNIPVVSRSDTPQSPNSKLQEAKDSFSNSFSGVSSSNASSTSSEGSSSTSSGGSSSIKSSKSSLKAAFSKSSVTDNNSEIPY